MNAYERFKRHCYSRLGIYLLGVRKVSQMFIWIFGHLNPVRAEAGI
jgi:hypothetical protein